MDSWDARHYFENENIQQTNDKYSFMGCVLKQLVDEIEKKHLKAAS